MKELQIFGDNIGEYLMPYLIRLINSATLK